MGLSTAWSQANGLTVPIANAPMGGVAGGRLAAAVSAAGGLGMIGLGSRASASVLAEELQHVRGQGAPFGIGMVAWVLEREPDLFGAALAAQPALISVSFTDEWSWVAGAHAEGIATATQVYDPVGARRAQEAGVDVLVARGGEGGGHGQPAIGTLPLLDAVLDSVSVPVLAAGGIASPRSLAAVLAAGASGAWLGTCLSSCPESLLSERTRQALLRAQSTDTVTTRVFDIAQGLPWPARFPDRVLRTESATRWAGREAELAADPVARRALGEELAADDGPVEAGQGVGMITTVRPAADVLAQLCVGAEALLRRWSVSRAGMGSNTSEEST